MKGTELKEKSQQLLDGPLKHIRGAALAAALLPLASVAAAPASAQSACSGGTLCGFVFNDTNGNGIQDANDTPLAGVKVVLSDGSVTYTDVDGFYNFNVNDGTYTVGVLVPPGKAPTTANVGSDDTVDSDGVADTFGFSTATVTLSGGQNSSTDFGFVVNSAPLNPGTGTPGYWKNHPLAWPVDTITVGGITYSKSDAITWLGRVGKDKTTTMFSSLVPAMLNVMIGNDNSCIQSSINWANGWMALHPVGSNVAASSPAWVEAEPYHKQLDAYNNGLICAPHRQ